MPRGRHSVVVFDGNVAIKRFKSGLKLNFWKEAYFLTILQPFDFVPKLFSVSEENLEIRMERIDGVRIGDYIVENGFDENVLRALEICRLLDRLGINKEEMTHPDKHILIGKKVWFIDFERSTVSGKPSNVTQFSVYLAKKLRKKCWSELGGLLKAYKKSYDDESFRSIVRFFTE